MSQENDWTEVYHPIIGARFRYRMNALTDKGVPSGLEMEQLDRQLDRWFPVVPHNFLDGFRLGYSAAYLAQEDES